MGERKVFFEGNDEGYVIADMSLWYRLNHEAFECGEDEEYDEIDDLCQSFTSRLTVVQFGDGRSYLIPSDLAAAIVNGYYWTNFE